MAKKRGRKESGNAVVKSGELLGWALGGLEREIDQTRSRLAALTQQANRLRARLGGQARHMAAQVVEEAPRRRRRMSAAARQKMSQLMKKRWAERRRKNKA